ncbi:CinA family protein [Spiroplasma tabanidicola]|uniref:Competence damage-inducible protein A n=1 Tax=Spiroplasma tabanidicola TaxID=324079 RepID=A0A6I6CBX4_9MOLU|nr:nicotinamide-nucleotide amidohydrolase family protein [Spiroplasma tabanidicola]QGS51728.1 competence damage-inducible protein A [Spiroplasma tabanidicola]
MNKLFEYLKNNNYTLASCESFTGGMFANLFTNMSGASDYFKGAYVCYSNEFKIKHLNIEEQIIKKNSEVSKEVLTKMLKQTQALLNVNVVFGFTGFASPIDNNNPRSGLSYVGFAINNDIFIYEFIDVNNLSREEYKIKAIEYVLKKFNSIWKKCNF